MISKIISVIKKEVAMMFPILIIHDPLITHKTTYIFMKYTRDTGK